MDDLRAGPPVDGRRLRTVLEDGLRRGRYPAAVALVVRGGRPGAAVAVGGAAPDDRFTLGPLADLPTAVVLLGLAERGTLDLDGPVGAWLPEFPQTTQAVTVRQLLTHTAGLPADFPRPASGEAAAGQVIAEPAAREPEPAALGPVAGARRLADRAAAAGIRPAYPPGLVHRRSAAGTVLAGLVAQRAGGHPLPALIAALTGVELATVRTPPGPPAGLAGTVADLARLGEALRAREVGLRPASLRRLCHDELPGLRTGGYRQGLGTRLADESFMGPLARPPAAVRPAGRGSGRADSSPSPDPGAAGPVPRGWFQPGFPAFGQPGLVVDPARELTVVLLASGSAADPVMRVVCALAAGE